jgi:hypothetical protein
LTIVPKTAQCKIAGNYSLILKSSSLQKLVSKNLQLKDLKTAVDIASPSQFISKILSVKDRISFELKNNKGNIFKDEFDVFGLFEELGGEYNLNVKKNLIFENVLKVEVRDGEIVAAGVTFELQYMLEPKLFSEVIEEKRKSISAQITNYNDNISNLTRLVEEIQKEFDEIMFDHDENVFYNESERIKEHEEQKALEIQQNEVVPAEEKAPKRGFKEKKVVKNENAKEKSDNPEEGSKDNKRRCEACCQIF